MRRLISLLILLPGPVFGSEVIYSPQGRVRDQLVKHINASETFIDLAMYSVTSGDIAKALANAAQRGVKIRVIRDSSQSLNKNDENAILQRNGIQVGIRARGGRGIMHDKFAVFDGKEILTGSDNWTNNAEVSNWENGLFSSDSNLIQAYEKEFEVLWKAPEK